MNKAFGNSDPKLEEYTYRVFAPEDTFLADVRERAARGRPARHPGRARSTGCTSRCWRGCSGARKAVEIGTLGGYSGTCLLRGMGPAGVLHTFEIEPKHAEVARETFRRAGFAEQRARPRRPGAGAARRASPPRARSTSSSSTPTRRATPALHRLGGGAPARRRRRPARQRLPLRPRRRRADGGERAAAIRGMRRSHEMLARSGRFRATMLPTGEGLAIGVKL